MLESLYDNYSRLTAEIVSNITLVQSSCNHSARLKYRQEVNRLMEQCRDILEQIELEIRDIKNADARQRQELRLRGLQQNVTSLNQNLQDALAKSVAADRESNERAELLGRKAGAASVASADAEAQLTYMYGEGEEEDQRQLLIGATERLDRSSAKLNHAQRVAMETERVGRGVLDDLGVQGETLRRARERLTNTDSALAKSARLVSTMTRRALQNRLVLYALAAIFFLVIIFTIGMIIWSRSRRH